MFVTSALRTCPIQIGSVVFFSNQAEHVWVPIILWELFLPWKQNERHPEHLSPFNALFDYEQDFKIWPDDHDDQTFY